MVAFSKCEVYACNFSCSSMSWMHVKLLHISEGHFVKVFVYKPMFLKVRKTEVSLLVFVSCNVKY